LAHCLRTEAAATRIQARRLSRIATTASTQRALRCGFVCLWPFADLPAQPIESQLLTKAERASLPFYQHMYRHKRAMGEAEQDLAGLFLCSLPWPRPHGLTLCPSSRGPGSSRLRDRAGTFPQLPSFPGALPQRATPYGPSSNAPTIPASWGPFYRDRTATRPELCRRITVPGAQART
jgi:hypothetical protein